MHENARVSFLGRHPGRNLGGQLERSRYDAIIDVPGERWEVEFLEGGDVEVERFCSNGEIGDESWLDDLFARFTDPKPGNARRNSRPPARAVKNHAVRSRK